MATQIRRKLEYDDRFALQQADQAIRKDTIRALVELITNSNDSYHRLEGAGIPCNGQIEIEVQRRHNNSVFRIRDYAEGMGDDQMDKMVGTYGAATSGFKEGRSVRGLWGRGLKDAFFGLGHGQVYSLRDSSFNHCSLLIKNHQPTFVKDPPIHASRPIRKQYNMAGNGTLVEVVVSRADIRVPQFDNLRRALERHFELRAIMSSSQRKVILRELDGKGKVKQEVELAYKPPLGTQVLDDEFNMPGFPAKVRLLVFRSDEPLSTPAEEGDYADGGLLVISRDVVLGLTFLKFENNEYAARFYGRITCDYLHDLLMKEQTEPVLTATRDGIEWKHPFTKALKSIVESKLEPLIDDERRRLQAEQKATLNSKLRKRLDDALKELNSIAQSELGALSGGSEKDGGEPGKTPVVPPNGFGFVPELVYSQTGKPKTLTLRAVLDERISSGSLVSIDSDNSEILVLTPRVVIEEREDFPGIGQAPVQVEGRQVGSEAIITARLNEMKAEALIKVISKKEGQVEPPQPRTSSGLFRGYRFDKTAEPKQRAYFERATSLIVIATQAPSVASYFDESGAGIDTPQAQVMLAELISEAVCNAIANRGVERGNFISVPGAETDAVRREYIRLQNQYAHHIHACFVDPDFRRNGNDGGYPRRKGRPRLVAD